MNAALIFAGGTGRRMNARTKPKQFLELHGKPILIYTLEHFDYHPDVEKIVIVCLKGWIEELKSLLRRFDIQKVCRIVPGGDTGHESIFNGLKAMRKFCTDEDIVLIHDGVRPLISKELISQNIEKAKAFGAAVTVEPAFESIIQSTDGETFSKEPDRGQMYVAKAPQTFRFGLIWEAYQRAAAEKLLTIDSSHLLSHYGYEMHMVKSTPNNIKITRPTDFYIFRALYEAMENYQIIGI